MVQLVYSRLVPQDGGAYNAGESVVFGSEFGQDVDNTLWDTAEEAVEGFLLHLTDPFGADLQAAADVTLAEGWLGWGTVVRATAQDGSEELYSLRVEEYEKEEQQDGTDIDRGSGGAAGDNG